MMRKSVGEKKRPRKNCEGKGTLKKREQVVRQPEARAGVKPRRFVQVLHHPAESFRILWHGSKFPMLRSPLRLNAEGAGVGRVPRHRLGLPDCGLVRLGISFASAGRYALRSSHGRATM